jgi:hypothetical protein
MSWIDDLGRSLPINDLYKDLAQPAVQQVGDVLGNAVRVARFALAPIDYLAAQHGRWRRYLERLAEKVPDDRRIDALPQVAGPVFEGLRYVEEGGIIAEMFLNLLARAIDRERVAEAHPAFAAVVGQLSPDEALILFYLKHRHFRLHQRAMIDPETKLFSSAQMISTEFPADELVFPGNLAMYLDHLQSLNLAILSPERNQEPIYLDEPRRQIGVDLHYFIQLTPFGILFGKACVPGEMFSSSKAEGEGIPNNAA